MIQTILRKSVFDRAFHFPCDRLLSFYLFYGRDLWCLGGEILILIAFFLVMDFKINVDIGVFIFNGSGGILNGCKFSE